MLRISAKDKIQHVAARSNTPVPLNTAYLSSTTNFLKKHNKILKGDINYEHNYT